PVVVLKYAVAKNGTSTTRPAYTITNNVVIGTATGRATVGAACDCAKPFTSGTTKYCTFVGAASPDTMAVCSLVP
ncbi:MAG: hypothetical protein K2Y02_12600, partial [Burkholderiaceae bacterium]|nr:hypothetical protein [Burkholderiaceae bacterium]